MNFYPNLEMQIDILTILHQPKPPQKLVTIKQYNNKFPNSFNNPNCRNYRLYRDI